MRPVVVLTILAMALTAGCLGGGPKTPESVAPTATPRPTAAPVPTVPAETLATAAPTPDIEATVQARVSADLTRVAPTPAPDRTDRPDARASAQDLTGICYRTPELQDVILDKLDVELCQAVNEKELFRIRKLVLQRQFREGCGVMPAWRRGAWHGSVWPVRYCPAYPQATAATRLARTVPGAAFPAPPGRPAAS